MFVYCLNHKFIPCSTKSIFASIFLGENNYEQKKFILKSYFLSFLSLQSLTFDLILLHLDIRCIIVISHANTNRKYKNIFTHKTLLFIKTNLFIFF